MNTAPTSVDLDAYLARIGFHGRASPDLATLNALQFGHVSAIPFENLSPLLGEPVALDAASLQDKLVARRRGGWCFEHNLLLAHVLRSIGFEVTTLAARVRWNVPPQVQTARSHCLLLVTIDGQRYIADAGFGGLTLTAPVRLEEGEQATPHEPHRLVREGETHALEARIGDEWQRLYVFDLVPALEADYEVSNWYLGHHPGSIFLKGLLCARADVDCRYALRGTRHAIHHRDGTTERRFIGSVPELKRALVEDFHIPLPASKHLDATLQRTIDAQPPP